MRLNVWVCTLTAIICLPTIPNLQAQDWLRQAISLEDRSHDFGTVARAAKTEHRFYITNVLDSKLHIRSVRASCGCTTPIVEDKWIAPNETGSILARFNTATFTGQRSATLTVTFDRPYFTELQLNVRGYIRSDVVLNPGEARFGSVGEGEGKQLELTLDYAGRNDWKMTKVDSPVEYISARTQEVSRGSGRVKYKIVAEISPQAPTGFHQNQLVIHTNDRRLRQVPLPYSANVQAPLQVSPEALSLGRLTADQTIKQRLVVKGKKPFRILNISSNKAEVSFEAGDDSKVAHLIYVTIAPNNYEAEQAESSEVQGKLILTTDLEQREIAVDLQYRVDPAKAAESVQ